MKAKMSNASKINILFSQYLKFINYPQTPFPNDIKITTKDIIYGSGDKQNGAIGTLKLLENDNCPFEFIIDKNALAYNDIFKSTLYHEFTHVMDDVILNKSDDYVDYFIKANNASEIRASYIQYLIETGSNSVSDFNIPQSHKIIDCDFTEKPTSIELLPMAYQDYLINLLTNSKETDFYELLHRNICYYIGFCRCIERKLGITMDHSKVVEAYSKFFGDSFKDIIQYGYEVDLGFDVIKIEDTLPLYNAIGNCLQFSHSQRLQNVENEKKQVLDKIEQMKHYTDMLENKEITFEEYKHKKDFCQK